MWFQVWISLSPSMSTCPAARPPPQALLHGLITLQKKIDAQSIKSVPWYDKDNPGDALPIPVLGPDLMDPRDYARIKEYTAEKAIAEAAAAEAAAEAAVAEGAAA